jgi:hypothetical protein
MPRKGYEIVEGSKENPIVVTAVVRAHIGKYGRLSLPGSWIGKKIKVSLITEVPEVKPPE